MPSSRRSAKKSVTSYRNSVARSTRRSNLGPDVPSTANIVSRPKSSKLTRGVSLKSKTKFKKQKTKIKPPPTIRSSAYPRKKKLIDPKLLAKLRKYDFAPKYPLRSEINMKLLKRAKQKPSYKLQLLDSRFLLSDTPSPSPPTEIMRFEIVPEEIMSYFTRATNSPSDCVVNALQIAKVITSETAEFLRRMPAVSKEGLGAGIPQINIESMCTLKYNYYFRFFTFRSYSDFKSILGTILPNTGIWVNVFFIGGGAHAILFVKSADPEGSIYIVDPMRHGPSDPDALELGPPGSFWPSFCNYKKFKMCEQFFGDDVCNAWEILHTNYEEMTIPQMRILGFTGL